MGVEFGGEDRLVAEHLLHCSEVGTAFDEVGGKRVAEGVRADVFGDTGCFGELLDYHEYHDPRERFASSIEKHKILATRLDFLGFAVVVDVVFEVVERVFGDRHKAFLIVFAYVLYIAEVFVDVGEFEVDEFGNTETTSLENFDESLVSMTMGLAEDDGG